MFGPHIHDKRRQTNKYIEDIEDLKYGFPWSLHSIVRIFERGVIRFFCNVP